jgi:hypothetical protein
MENGAFFFVEDLEAVQVARRSTYDFCSTSRLPSARCFPVLIVARILQKPIVRFGGFVEAGEYRNR